ncbi:MAG: hypothetical protein K2L06_01015 [Alistipes sp.]|nr:hypothetical protein [Alistipes sp.]
MSRNQPQNPAPDRTQAAIRKQSPLPLTDSHEKSTDKKKVFLRMNIKNNAKCLVYKINRFIFAQEIKKEQHRAGSLFFFSGCSLYYKPLKSSL